VLLLLLADEGPLPLLAGVLRPRLKLLCRGPTLLLLSAPTRLTAPKKRCESILYSLYEGDGKK